MARKRIDQLDLVAVARRQRQLLFLASAMLLVLVAMIAVRAAMPVPPLLETAFWTLQILLAVIGTVLLARLYMAMGENPVIAVLVGLFMVIPLLGLLILLAASSQSSTILKLAGVRVGLLGVSEPEREKLRPQHCRGCGYSRQSLELLAPCPECGRVPIVW